MNSPIHLFLSQAEKQHLKQMFLQEHATTVASPLIFPEQKVFGHYNYPQKTLQIKQPKAHTKPKNNPARPFTLNLAFSDKEIIQAVENYLKDVRPKQAIGKAKLQKKLSSWRTNQIFAVKDLIDWGTFSDEKLTHAEIADAVWPPFAASSEKIINYGERIRKSSVPDIEEAFTEVTYGLFLDTINPV